MIRNLDHRIGVQDGATCALRSGRLSRSPSTREIYIDQPSLAGATAMENPMEKRWSTEHNKMTVQHMTKVTATVYLLEIL